MAKNRDSDMSGQLSLFGNTEKRGTQKTLFDAIDTEPKAESGQTVDVQPESMHQADPDGMLLKRLESMTNAELEAEVHRHNVLYNEGRPEIADLTYDRLVQRLRDMEPQSAVADELTSPEVSGSSRGKVVHQIPMLSIQKPDIRRVFDEIGNWLDKFGGDVMATPKIDGLACSIQYDQNGELLVASTRGNGRVGENITPNARYIEAIPKKIDVPNLEVRGEVYMPLSSFRAFEGEKISARNLAVGGLKQKDAAETARYHLSFFAYEALGVPFLTESEKFSALEKLGFITPEHHLLKRGDHQPLIDIIKQFCDRMLEQRDSWNFDADGLVFKVDDNAVQREMGNTDHHPRCAIAYKFPCVEQESTLREVRWQVAKGATLTPVAIFDTVELAGAMVQKATLSNAGMVREFPVGAPDKDKTQLKDHLKIGARVLVSRRGDVIPHIEYVVSVPEDARDVELPKVCPSCGSPVIEDGLFLRCSDPDNCPATGQALIENYTKVVGCMGFGGKIIEYLYDESLIETPADLYRLSVGNIAQAIASGDDGSIDPDALLPKKLFDSIQNSRKMPLARFLESLSIPALGRVNSQKLAKYFKSIHVLLDAELKDILLALSELKEQLKNTSQSVYDKIQTSKNDDIGLFSQWVKNSLVPKNMKKYADCLISAFHDFESLKKADCEAIYQCLSDNSMDEMLDKKLSDDKSAKNARTVFAALKKRRSLIDDLLQFVEIEQENDSIASGKQNIFTGKTILFTGTLVSMKREEAQARAEALGAKAVSGISKNLSILVATSSTSSKWTKAQEFNAKGANILIWTEEEFLEALEKAIE